MPSLLAICINQGRKLLVNGPSKIMHLAEFESNFIGLTVLNFFAMLSWNLDFFCKAKKVSAHKELKADKNLRPLFVVLNHFSVE